MKYAIFAPFYTYLYGLDDQPAGNSFNNNMSIWFCSCGRVKGRAEVSPPWWRNYKRHFWIKQELSRSLLRSLLLLLFQPTTFNNEKYCLLHLILPNATRWIICMENRLVPMLKRLLLHLTTHDALRVRGDLCKFFREDVSWIDLFTTFLSLPSLQGVQSRVHHYPILPSHQSCKVGQPEKDGLVQGPPESFLWEWKLEPWVVIEKAPERGNADVAAVGLMSGQIAL